MTILLPSSGDYIIAVDDLNGSSKYILTLGQRYSDSSLEVSTDFIPDYIKGKFIGYKSELIKNVSRIGSSENNKKQFSIDGVKGSWLLDDSLLLFENIPESKTYIDSMFVVNDMNGNSTIVLQNGDQKIATIKDGLVIPEKVKYKMKVISVNLDQLILQIDGDFHTYNKIN